MYYDGANHCEDTSKFIPGSLLSVTGAGKVYTNVNGSIFSIGDGPGADCTAFVGTLAIKEKTQCATAPALTAVTLHMYEPFELTGIYYNGTTCVGIGRMGCGCVLTLPRAIRRSAPCPATCYNGTQTESRYGCMSALCVSQRSVARPCVHSLSRPAVCADGSCVGLYGNSGTCNFAPSTFASGSLTTLAGVGFTYIENNGAALPAYDFCYDQRTSPPLPPLPPPQPPAPPLAQRCGTAPFINSNDVRLAAELGSEKMDVSDASQYLNPVNITFTGLYQPADYCKATYPACGSTCGSGCLTCVAIARQSLPRLTLEPPLPSQLRGWHVRGRVQLQAGQRSGCE